MTKQKTNRSMATRVARRLPLLIAVGAAALIIAPAASAKSAKFGANVNPQLQPSNSAPAHDCDAAPGERCSWVLNDAYQNAGNEGAPHKGKLKKIKLVAGEAGSFKLQVVKMKPGDRAKVKRNGPKINYEGQPENVGDVYNVEKFKVNVPIKKGEYLAIKAKTTSMLRCSSGGDNTLLYAPPLKKGDSFRTADGDDGCYMTMQGIVKY
ncbi:MAG: hypothetical protein ACR2N5_01435 [Solirubrobacterales bacterium]